MKRLCALVFPTDYPDYWYGEITRNERLFALAAISGKQDERCGNSRLVGLPVAEVKTFAARQPEDRYILASSFAANTHVEYILSLGVLGTDRRRGLATRLVDEVMRLLIDGKRKVPSATVTQSHEENSSDDAASSNE